MQKSNLADLVVTLSHSTFRKGEKTYRIVKIDPQNPSQCDFLLEVAQEGQDEQGKITISTVAGEYTRLFRFTIPLWCMCAKDAALKRALWQRNEDPAHLAQLVMSGDGDDDPLLGIASIAVPATLKEGDLQMLLWTNIARLVDEMQAASMLFDPPEVSSAKASAPVIRVYH